MNRIGRLALGAGAMLLVGACGGGTSNSAGQKSAAPVEASMAPVQQTASPEIGERIALSDGTTTLFWGEADVRGKTSASLEIRDAGSGRYYFSPTILVGSPGQTLTLEVANRSTTGHPFTISSKSVDVAPGRRSAMTVSFPAAGALTFACPHGHAGEFRVA